jgi:hypothetical protein
MKMRIERAFVSFAVMASPAGFLIACCSLPEDKNVRDKVVADDGQVSYHYKT